MYHVLLCSIYWLFLPWSVNDTFASPSISNYYHDLEGRQWGHSIKPTHYTPYHRSCTEGAWWIYMKHYHKSLIVQLLLFTPFIIVYSIRLFMYISFLLLTNDKIMMVLTEGEAKVNDKKRSTFLFYKILFFKPYNM